MSAPSFISEAIMRQIRVQTEAGRDSSDAMRLTSDATANALGRVIGALPQDELSFERQIRQATKILTDEARRVRKAQQGAAGCLNTPRSDP